MRLLAIVDLVFLGAAVWQGFCIGGSVSAEGELAGSACAWIGG